MAVGGEVSTGRGGFSTGDADQGVDHVEAGSQDESGEDGAAAAAGPLNVSGEEEREGVEA